MKERSWQHDRAPPCPAQPVRFHGAASAMVDDASAAAPLVPAMTTRAPPRQQEKGRASQHKTSSSSSSVGGRRTDRAESAASARCRRGAYVRAGSGHAALAPGPRAGDPGEGRSRLQLPAANVRALFASLSVLSLCLRASGSALLSFFASRVWVRGKFSLKMKMLLFYIYSLKLEMWLAAAVYKLTGSGGWR